MVKYQADLEAWKKRDKTQGHSQSKKATGKKEKPTPPKKPIPRMQENEPYNFLWFATALKIILGSSVKEEAILRATNLLYQYLCGFRVVHQLLLICFCFVICIIWTP